MVYKQIHQNRVESEGGSFPQEGSAGVSLWEQAQRASTPAQMSAVIQVAVLIQHYFHKLVRCPGQMLL